MVLRAVVVHAVVVHAVVIRFGFRSIATAGTVDRAVFLNSDLQALGSDTAVSATDIKIVVDSDIKMGGDVASGD